MPNLLDSCLPMTGLPLIRVIALLGTLSGAVALSGCTSQEAASRLLVEPDRYVLYNCPEIATASQANMARQRELEGLMAKAGTSAGGQLASGMAYAPEYNQLRGEMVQLRKAADDKNCRTGPGAPAPRSGVPVPTR
jgi:hypothetical protein